MMLGVRRLIRVEEIICREMRSRAVLNNTLGKFRQERKMRDRSIVGEVFFVRIVFLEESQNKI